jgi:hypothetical protein
MLFMNYTVEITKVACPPEGSPFGTIPAGKFIDYGILQISDAYDPEVEVYFPPPFGGSLRPLYMKPDGKLNSDNTWIVGDWYREGDDLVWAFDWFKYNEGCSVSFFPPIGNCEPPFQQVYTPLLGGPDRILPPPPDPCAPNVKE